MPLQTWLTSQGDVTVKSDPRVVSSLTMPNKRLQIHDLSDTRGEEVPSLVGLFSAWYSPDHCTWQEYLRSSLSC